MAIHTTGSSLFDTQALLTRLFGITPALNTIWHWKLQLGIQAPYLNQEALGSVQTPTIRMDEFFVTLRDGQTAGQHTAALATVIQEDQFGAILQAGVTLGRQTNLAIMESNLRQVQHHQPKKVVEDGCSSYPGAVDHVLPEAQFVRDLVHEVRNVRKKPRVKSWLQTQVTQYQTSLETEWEQQLQFDRQRFVQTFLESYRDQPWTQMFQRAARQAWDQYR